MNTKTIAFNLKNITDLKEYDGDILKGEINFNEIAKINKNYIDGNIIYINTEINHNKTEIFLRDWGIMYSRIVTTGIISN